MNIRGLLMLCIVIGAAVVGASDFNAFGLKRYTIESAHFRIHYYQGLDRVARESAQILEDLYETFRSNYRLTLSGKTDILLIDNDQGDGYADPFTHTILISAAEIDFPLRGSHDWLRDVLTHEYAHIVSITAGLKGPPWFLGFQLGYFNHPNIANRAELFHLLISENLPRWYSEGIAQHESARNGGDSWDSHRDMILRTLTLSDRLLTYDNMCVFAGRLDDFEKSYNQGFSLINHMVDNYGMESVAAILRESAKPYRLDFDGAIKNVVGISARQVYGQWKKTLQTRYKKQLERIGPQVYGKKISQHGFHNYFPRFSPDEKKIYFTSNEKSEYTFSKGLYSYSLSDTIKKEDRIKPELATVRDFYSIHHPSGHIAFSSMKSPKSTLPPHRGGTRTRDIFTDTLPPEKKPFRPFTKTERQVSRRQSLFVPSFSPDGRHIAAAQHRQDNYFLVILDTAGKNLRTLYPDPARPETAFKNIYATDWAPDGRRIAINYIDVHNRKIGIYDTVSRELLVLCDTDGDERDPQFSHDGRYLYFASDRSGIFNIYRFDFQTSTLARLTNVSGGAFSPAVSRDGKRLAYVNYDADGFGIYLIDSVSILEETVVDSPMVPRRISPSPALSVSVTSPRTYSFAPRKLLVMPTLFMEEAVTENDDPFTGRSTVKAGAVVNAEDPFSLNRLGFGLFLEPDKIFKFINLDDGLISPEVNYDVSLYGETRLLPVTLSLDFLLRGITGHDWIYDELFDTTYVLRYGLRPSWLNLFASHALNKATKLHLGAGYNNFGVFMLGDQGYPDLTYTAAKGSRLGAYLTMLNWVPRPAMNISPVGLYFKAGYNLLNQRLMKEEQGLVAEGGVLKENFDVYDFHELRGAVKLGLPSPWYSRHDLYFDLRATGIELTEACKQRLRSGNPDEKPGLPAYYQPAEWVPGYAYYTQEVRNRVNANGDSVEYLYDTALVSGNTVAYAAVSYRFPLIPNRINRKIGFIYLDRIYGALNLRGGAGWEKPSDFLKFNKNDWLLAPGAEVRLEAISFNMLPLAVGVGWDWGMGTPDNRMQSPAGGHRFTLKLGFSFDGWEMIDYPDYLRPARLGGRIR